MRTLLSLVLAAVVAAAGPARAHSTGPSGLAAVKAGLAAMATSGAFSGDVLIARDGRPVFERAYGLANRERGTPNTLSTRFNLASLGKSLTAVAVARLVQEGRLHFTDPVGRYIPGLRTWAGARLTIAALLDHTSGLGDFFESPDYEALRPRLTSLRRYLPLIRAAPISPAGPFRYSNSGYLLLGLVIERASNEDYYTFLRKQVFDRAGMSHSGCFFADRLPAATAIGYASGAVPNTGGLPPRGTSAGGCYSTVGDLLAFANALRSHRLLNARLTRLLTTPKVTVGPGQQYGYGFGIRSGRPGEPPTIWHNGGSPGVGAELDVNGPLGYTIVVLANRDYPTIRPAIDLILDRLHIP